MQTVFSGGKNQMLVSWAVDCLCLLSPLCAPTTARVWYLGGEICHVGVDIFSSYHSTEGKHQTCQIVRVPYLRRPLTFIQPVPSSCQPRWHSHCWKSPRWLGLYRTEDHTFPCCIVCRAANALGQSLEHLHLLMNEHHHLIMDPWCPRLPWGLSQELGRAQGGTGTAEGSRLTVS